MTHKVFSISILLFILFFNITLNLISFFYDPYGLECNLNKRVENLMPSTSLLIQEKLNKKAQYYIVGTSRTLQINPLIPQKYLKSKVLHLGFNDYTLSSINLLAQQIKKQGGKMIIGLDAFSINHTYDKTKYQSVRYLKKEISSTHNAPYFFNYHFVLDTLSTVFKDISGLPKDSFFEHINNKFYKNNSYEEIYNFFVYRNNSHYNQYLIVKKDIQKLKSILSPEDIIIIFPKFFLYYKIFTSYPNNHQTIQQQYFSAIKELIVDLNLKIWSFYGINTVTLNKDNFDDYGWHFKPKIAPLIFARIFNDKSIKVPKDFGVLLTKDNIDEELEKIKKREKQYFQE